MHPWSRSFVIARRDEREKAEVFNYYVSASVEAVNKVIHAGAVNGCGVPDQVLKNIMDSYGAMYNERLKADQATA